MKGLVLNFTLCMIAFWVVTCDQKYSAEKQTLFDKIQQQRLQKDSLFQYAEWSPIADSIKDKFNGLKYYPIHLSLRYEGPISRSESVILDTIRGTKGDLRPAIKYGFFSFTHKNQLYKLEIYKFNKDEPEFENYLFLGFTDETSGKETYGAGRYIDMEENEENQYVVDFNLAYNPYCAYNSKYTCAIPPKQNRLPFAVHAGEKKYK
jgi:uncharacterized protein (DUF1684 family)